jgi:hypothetical protein
VVLAYDEASTVMTRVAPAVLPATGSAEPRSGGAGAGGRAVPGLGDDGLDGDGLGDGIVAATGASGGAEVLEPGRLATALAGDPVGVREALFGVGVADAEPSAALTGA